jgi:hypothetical protein
VGVWEGELSPGGEVRVELRSDSVFQLAFLEERGPIDRWGKFEVRSEEDGATGLDVTLDSDPGTRSIDLVVAGDRMSFTELVFPQARGTLRRAAN